MTDISFDDRALVIATLDAAGKPVAVSPANPLPGTGGSSTGTPGLARVRSCTVSSGILPVQATSGWVFWNSPGVIAAAITGIILGGTAIVPGANTLLRWAVDPLSDAEAALLLPTTGFALSPSADLGNVGGESLNLNWGGTTPITGTLINTYIPIPIREPSSGDALRALAFAHNLGAGSTLTLIVTGWEKVS